MHRPIFLACLPMVLLAGCVNRQETAIIQPSSAPRTAVVHTSTPPLLSKTMVAGTSLRLGSSFDLNPDCSVHGTPDIRVTQQPVHGTVQIVHDQGFPNYRAPNPRAACNTKRAPTTTTIYTPDKDFTGTDIMTLEQIGEGTDSTVTVEITVK